MLNYTTGEIYQREGLTINPAKICQPIGAVHASLGIHRCMPYCHGSQGCASYLRMHLSRHFREPIMTAGSYFTEGSAVFGGAGNLKQGIRNVIAIYKPDVIAIHTTCSTETIGDDVPGTIERMRRDGDIPPYIRVFSANTPSYIGSHITGFANMTKEMVNTFARGEDNKRRERINLIPGFCEPADIREIKRILRLMGIDSIIFPDITGVVDAPMTGRLELYPRGGTRSKDLEDTPNSLATFGLGREATEKAAVALEKEFYMPSVILPPPIGVRNTDLFIMKLREVTGAPVPYEIEEERGRVVDMMTDAPPHFHGRRMAIYGDPDIVMGITGLGMEMGMEPAYILTGTRSEAFEREVMSMIMPDFPETRVRSGGDLFLLHQWIKERGVDLLIGNTYGKYIAKAEDIPLVRVGFPILDRANLHHFPIFGYSGAARLVERIGNTLLDRRDRDMDDTHFELIM